MRITADTNLLVRVATEDDEEQAATARRVLATAESVVVPLPCVMEFVWVLRSVHRFSRDDVARALLSLIGSSKVVADGAAIKAGLRVHAAGGDFADGVIAAVGASMGAEAFVSFDRKAVACVRAIGMRAELPSVVP